MHTSLNKSEKVSKWETMFINVLKHLDYGTLKITAPDGIQTIIGTKHEGPVAEMRISDPKFYKYCALYGDIGMGLAYNHGLWETSDIEQLMKWFMVNISSINNEPRSTAKSWAINLLKVVHKLTRNRKGCDHIDQYNKVSGSKIALFSYFPEPN